jgi:hypothetical protein
MRRECDSAWHINKDSEGDVRSLFENILLGLTKVTEASDRVIGPEKNFKRYLPNIFEYTRKSQKVTLIWQ